tara:strand:- start:480 stop:956 length:477 start_codon:yes stop_codon:yes gene_type:complete
MIAIIKTGGKQYAVKAGQILKVEKLLGKKGDNISLNNVIALTDSSNHTLGNPLIKGATVDAKILDQIRDKKIIVFKKRRRQNYRSTQGHRQYLTVLKIESINHEGKKITAPKTEKINKEPKIVKKDEIKVIKKTVSKKKIVKKVVKKKTVTKKTIKNK